MKRIIVVRKKSLKKFLFIFTLTICAICITIVIKIDLFSCNKNFSEHSHYDHMFKNLDEFEEYIESGRILDDFKPLYYAETGEQVFYDSLIPVIPEFDDAKYEQTGVLLNNSDYISYFINTETKEEFSFKISFGTCFHSYEEMANAMKSDPLSEKTEVVIWGNTPALIYKTSPSESSEYYISAMINENNSIFFSHDGWSSKELSECLNEFKFKSICLI